MITLLDLLSLCIREVQGKPILVPSIVWNTMVDGSRLGYKATKPIEENSTVQPVVVWSLNEKFTFGAALGRASVYCIEAAVVGSFLPTCICG